MAFVNAFLTQMGTAFGGIGGFALIAVLGMVIHTLKTVIESSVDGNPIGFWAYFAKNKPQLILSVLTTLAALVVGAQMGDLNAYSALLAGYGGNSFGSLAGSRTPN